MDSERIEQILQRHYPADMPDGMKERVLSKATTQLGPARRRPGFVLKLVFAAALILLVALANVSDHARQVRLAGGHWQMEAGTFAVIAEQRRITQLLLASTDTWDVTPKARKQL
jgi:hypothetical protein